ncbi:DUF4071 domain-containing protein [Cellulomonas humilata]|uniref:DUF4071 domain-containing protein n=1 Tax=Cellulomonas humilata TaxID=144055 RepID=A0A7Y6A2B0_9CELL|nr:TRAFs-binding domain-containing protein [Cellulomonas humilata]NUU18494.1 DUF4071 domain-containing protein [Cellulomonas humilata]
MPFGTKPDPAQGAPIDFNRVYDAAIRPGVVAAGMEPIRADEEELGGIIHKAMFERLLLCEFAVADLTTSNANVLYELGIRHAARPRSTLTLFAAHKPLPFDVNLLRTVRYDLGGDNTLSDEEAYALRDTIAEQLTALRARARTDPGVDSPLFQMIDGWRPRLPSPAASQLFLAQARSTEELNRRLRDVRAAAMDGAGREHAAQELAQLRADAGAAEGVDVSVRVGLMLAYRALEDWAGMIQAHGELPEELASQPAVLQQLAFAHNRRADATGSLADRGRALDILRELEVTRGPTAETSGLIGRIYKSQWRRAVDEGKSTLAQGLLEQAIEAYVRGFETDWRDVYPGVNAATLLDVEGSPESTARKDRMLPVVQFAADQRIRSPRPGYWDWATQLELAVLAREQEKARAYLSKALAAVEESWEPESTASNLRMVAGARAARGESTGWVQSLVDELDPGG